MKRDTRTEPRRDADAVIMARFPAAYVQWSVQLPGETSGSLACYVINGRTVLVQIFPDGNGWDAYTPTTDENSIPATLDAIEARTRGLDYDYRAR